jgi:Cathepsin propeptide inhibitor domain (I29)
MTDKEQAFLHFLARYGKTYASKSVVSSRFDIFSRNYDRIQEHNSLSGERFQMGINQFSDMTEEEFSQRLGGVKKPVGKKSSRPVLRQE